MSAKKFPTYSECIDYIGNTNRQDVNLYELYSRILFYYCSNKPKDLIFNFKSKKYELYMYNSTGCYLIFNKSNKNKIYCYHHIDLIQAKETMKLLIKDLFDIS